MKLLQYGLVGNVLAVDGEVMNTALLNTVLGMGIVFIVLIFISLLISCFKIIPMIQKKLERKQKAEEIVEQSNVQAVEQVVEEENLVDDTELVAVITAAIMASMGSEVPADGLVVRSIRKVKKRR